ncbi:hypothetical protein [Micromonospora chalcea]|uniref:hypothetical protein n=1 Tax=Micromonospora chalcea TaxID=1874 RepID=UPI003325A935
MEITALATQSTDIDYLIRIAAVVGPLAGVWFGGQLSRQTHRQGLFPLEIGIVLSEMAGADDDSSLLP